MPSEKPTFKKKILYSIYNYTRIDVSNWLIMDSYLSPPGDYKLFERKALWIFSHYIILEVYQVVITQVILRGK